MAPDPSAAQSAMSAPRRCASRDSAASSIRPAARSRGQLAEAVAADHVGPDPEVLEDSQQSQADRPDRRLGEPRVAQGVLAAPGGSVRRTPTGG